MDIWASLNEALRLSEMLGCDDFPVRDFCEWNNVASAGLLDGLRGCINATCRDLVEGVMEHESGLLCEVWVVS
jgi:hypothetical protein